MTSEPGATSQQHRAEHEEERRAEHEAAASPDAPRRDPRQRRRVTRTSHVPYDRHADAPPELHTQGRADDAEGHFDAAFWREQRPPHYGA